MILNERVFPLPTILMANVNRAFSKLDDIKASILSKNVHVFAATETWFSSVISDEIVGIDNFTFYRDDRSDGRVGGGVGVWVHTSFHATRYFFEGPTFGTESVCLLFTCIKTCFLCIYVPPSSVIQSSSDVSQFIAKNLDNIMLHNPDFKLLLTGDFNRLNVSYLLNSFDLHNVVLSPTRKEATLDLVLMSEALVDHYNVEVGPPIASSDHRSIFCEPKNACQFLDIRESVFYDFRESNVNAFLSELNQFDLSHMYDMKLSVNEKCSILNDAVRFSFLRCIPCHSVTMSSKDKPYVTPMIKHLIDLRWDAYRRRHFPLYRHLRDKIKNMLFIEKLKWTKRAYHSPKDMWKVVNEMTGSKSAKLSASDSIAKQFTSPQEAARQINAAFAATQTLRSAPEPIECVSDWNPVITSANVFRALSALKPGKAAGCENIPTAIYKKAASTLSAPLTHIINVSIQHREFPDCWKHSLIVPVPKSHPPSKSELRPISLLPALSKVCEKLVLSSGLLDQFKKAFGVMQFGGLKLSSSTAALVCIHEFVTRALEDRECVGVAVLAYDFSKAFDRLGHDTITKVLSSNDFPSGFIQWVRSYLSNRTQSVKISNVTSPPLPVTSGVPQGSIFGPFFFNTVVGSLKPVSSKSKIIKFIDDCTYVVPIYPHCSNILSEEHQNMLEWSDAIGLSLNLRKTKFLWIPRAPDFAVPCVPNLSPVEEVRILGVILSRDLKWDKHFDSIVKCCSRRLFALRILRPLLQKRDLIVVYQALIRSLMEYCAPLFVSLSSRNKNLLCKLQRRAHRIICDQKCQCELFEDLCTRRENAAIKFLKKIAACNEHPLRFLCPSASARSGRLLQPPARTSRRLRSFFPATILLLNNVPLHDSITLRTY